MSTIRIRAIEQQGIVDLRALMEHPMETGTRRDNDGNLVPPHHITEIRIQHNDRTIMQADWGGGISRNPYLAIRFRGRKGDGIRLSWIDNLGQQDAAEAIVG